MKEKIDRQKINERDEFEFEERQRIAMKSDHKCSHCGREVYFGYGATIDHFIPLSKGGTNRDINLVMLCKDCNKEKRDQILYPEHYLPYLKEEHRKALNGYYESYRASFEYVERTNLLCCDSYPLSVQPPCITGSRYRKNRRCRAKNIHYLKRAVLGDIPRIDEYFISYLKKYGMLDSVEAAKANIEFWMRFGCIYYIEKNDDIKIMTTVTVTDDQNRTDNIGKYLTFNIFSYYNTDYALTLVEGIMDMMASYIMEEQDLTQLPTKYCIAAADKLSAYALGSNAIKTGNFRELYVINVDKDSENRVSVEKDEALSAFFDKFSDIKEKAEAWLGKMGDDEMRWMMGEIITGADDKAAEDAS